MPETYPHMAIGLTPGMLPLTYNISEAIDSVRKRPGMYIGTFARDPLTIYQMSVFLTCLGNVL